MRVVIVCPAKNCTLNIVHNDATYQTFLFSNPYNVLVVYESDQVFPRSDDSADKGRRRQCNRNQSSCLTQFL